MAKKIRGPRRTVNLVTQITTTDYERLVALLKKHKSKLTPVRYLGLAARVRATWKDRAFDPRHVTELPTGRPHSDATATYRLVAAIPADMKEFRNGSREHLREAVWARAALLEAIDDQFIPDDVMPHGNGLGTGRGKKRNQAKPAKVRS